MFRRNHFIWWPCAVLALAAGSATADPLAGTNVPRSAADSTVPATALTTLKQAFDAAWQRQPEAQSQQLRQDAAAAQQQAATRWTAEPLALELSSKTDRLNQNLGRDETVAGISVTLWLPGERTRTIAVADAQARAVASRVRVAQLRTAASVREAYWAWARARMDHALAAELLIYAQQLAQDVGKRVRAGDLARADQHQADGAQAQAEATLAESAGALASASQRLQALTGLVPPNAANAASGAATAVAEPVPAALAEATILDASHPSLAELQDTAAVAQHTAALTAVQTRANPELTLATNRDRGAMDEAYQQSITLGIRIPLGADSRNQAKRASAQADALEAEVQARLAHDRLRGEVQAARVGLASAQTRVDAAKLRARLARESRAFFQKSFQAGETDVPTRLRMEREAMDAERQAARADIDLAAAQSDVRQALGLLPQ